MKLPLTLKLLFFSLHLSFSGNKEVFILCSCRKVSCGIRENNVIVESIYKSDQICFDIKKKRNFGSEETRKVQMNDEYRKIPYLLVLFSASSWVLQSCRASLLIRITTRFVLFISFHLSFCNTEISRYFDDN